MHKLIVIEGLDIQTSTFDGYHAETCADQCFRDEVADGAADFVILMHGESVRSAWSKDKVKGPWIDNTVPMAMINPVNINRQNCD